MLIESLGMGDTESLVALALAQVETLHVGMTSAEVHACTTAFPPPPGATECAYFTGRYQFPGRLEHSVSFHTSLYEGTLKRASFRYSSAEPPPARQLFDALLKILTQRHGPPTFENSAGNAIPSGQLANAKVVMALFETSQGRVSLQRYTEHGIDGSMYQVLAVSG